MRFTLTYLWPLLVSISIQGLLGYVYFVSPDLMDRQAVAVVASCGIAVSCISLVGYRLLMLGETKTGWSPAFLLLALAQFLCLAGSAWFLLVALIGRAPVLI